MARYAGANDKETYRVVIVTTYPANPKSDYEPHRVERTSTEHYGPYRTKGAAGGMKTRQTRLSYWERENGTTKEGWVERATTTWERVG